jgi:hypothetical protein
MSRVTVSDRWLVTDSEPQVRKEILAFLNEQKMELVETADGTIEAIQGSQVQTRLIGGWFVHPRVLPKRVRISLRETEQGIDVRARMEETYGFGFMAPMLEQKYKSVFQEWLVELQTAIT